MIFPSLGILACCRVPGVLGDGVAAPALVPPFADPASSSGILPGMSHAIALPTCVTSNFHIALQTGAGSSMIKTMYF